MAGADLTIRADVERHNFEPVAAGEAIGWVRPGVEKPLEVRCADGRDHTDGPDTDGPDTDGTHHADRWSG